MALRRNDLHILRLLLLKLLRRLLLLLLRLEFLLVLTLLLSRSHIIRLHVHILGLWGNQIGFGTETDKGSALGWLRFKQLLLLRG